MSEPKKHFRRSRDSRMIGGVFGGISKYYDIDPSIPRIIAFLFLTVWAGGAATLYLACWLIIPLEDDPSDPNAQSQL